MKALRFVLASLVAMAVPAAAEAGVVTYSGFLDNPASLAPAGGQLVNFLNLGAPDLTTFPDQNVALFTFSVAAPTTFVVRSKGYNDIYGNTPGIDGFDAYVALFSGTGNGATWIDEFANPVVAGDFEDTTAMLAAGTYTLAISMYQNLACGAGWCIPTTGTLGDGFSGLSFPDLSRQLYFEVDLEDRATPVPEPSTIALLAAGAMLARRRIIRLTRS
jgi:hypothetical protein